MYIYIADTDEPTSSMNGLSTNGLSTCSLRRSLLWLQQRPLLASRSAPASTRWKRLQLDGEDLWKILMTIIMCHDNDENDINIYIYTCNNEYRLGISCSMSQWEPLKMRDERVPIHSRSSLRPCRLCRHFQALDTSQGWDETATEPTEGPCARPVICRKMAWAACTARRFHAQQLRLVILRLPRLLGISMSLTSQADTIR